MNASVKGTHVLMFNIEHILTVNFTVANNALLSISNLVDILHVMYLYHFES